MAEESTEDRKTRINRELIEFLNELRVALPGVQVLFAFLLTVPFSQRFPELSAGEKRVYFTAVICAALSSTLLIAPAAHHRMRFRSGNKEQILKVGTVLATIGTFFLAVGMGAALHLIARFLFGSGAALVAVSVVGSITLLLWFGLPLLYKSNDER